MTIPEDGHQVILICLELGNLVFKPGILNCQVFPLLNQVGVTLLLFVPALSGSNFVALTSAMRTGFPLNHFSLRSDNRVDVTSASLLPSLPRARAQERASA